ncbi:uncharacterized protein L3040_008450 [Drepanopeziza brunnea f. sp. 'multigermtubi']|uniref:Uncharacterized protein n=1 Tax=Marssonina brunnea f. sp. multigermtubi (strain MB_m1) TaxID=1072389 RepID=K1WFT1_MARBU|nr:uncharacterized protein MBM_05644 [Drepanopeziza brunnea f. sp. 'multigermtubi' MB_m1]EKD16350.1 hypothetical protein MBM_05644 [Drepanopeziza brunnea f. sp. 'multigermtubi' MB_m1]KAJ5033332.1 hypothetical protein L3040_008450 [Drepanopeziza brunnea f. sp. 'multigermtubi']
MAVSARMLTEKVIRSMFNHTGNRTIAFSQNAVNRTGSSGNSTSNLISNLVFAESKSVRTSTIILATFNVLAALATASSILYDCYCASKRCNPRLKASKICVSSIHPAETFPLVLALGIAIQGLVFAGVQGEGLSSLFVQNTCGLIAQFLWPALFVVPFIQLVFGAECAIRSFRSIAFQARGKWDVTICLGVILVMIIGVWIPAHVRPQPESCFASLIWFVSGLGLLGFVLLCITGVLMIAAAVTIFMRLSTVNLIDQHQRIAASRIVYYLILGIISLVFVTPFFYTLIDKEGDIKLSMMATVVLNLSGLMSGLLHLFLRSNTTTTSFAPKTMTKDWDHPRHALRMFGPNELAMRAHLINPVTGPDTLRDDLESRASRPESDASLIGFEKGRGIYIASLRSTPYEPQKYLETEMSPMPKISRAADAVNPGPAVSGRALAGNPSYSLFPAENHSPLRNSPKRDSVYDISDISDINEISDLAPPPPLRHTGGPRHKRNSSDGSSATVQIGLRLSHAPPTPQEDLDTLPLPSTTYKGSTLQVPGARKASSPRSAPRLATPPNTYSAASERSLPPSPAAAKTKATSAGAPLKVQTNFASLTSSKPGLVTPVSTSRNHSPQLRTPTSMNKAFPLTPKVYLPQIEKIRESITQLSPTVYTPSPAVYSLSPTVYSPEKKVTVPARSPLHVTPPGSPEAGPSKTRPPLRTKMDWI